jgi:hypothetical protein
VRNVTLGWIGLSAASGAAALLSLAALAALAACSSLTTADSTTPFPQDAGTAREGGPSADGGSFSDAGSTIPGSLVQANALVLVHAASFPAFRMCFEGAAADLPQPSVDLMPDSNVVGVDVGTAVRLAARPETLGHAYVFPEAVLRPLYPTFGGPGPSCAQLLKSSPTNQSAVDVGVVTANVSSGVHALVLTGCRAASIDPVASKNRCGADWNAATGNLSLTTLSLMAYARLGETRLPVQLVQLSPALQMRAAGRALGLAFGALDGGAAGAAPAPFVEGAVPFGVPVPNPPAILDYTAADLGSYATSGIFVTLGGAIYDAGMPTGGDSGARETLVVQSLADIQKRSSPRSLPPDWFATASSYVVLSVGDTDPRLSDGGRDDDPRRALHLLAVPLATPDAGTATDGGL